MVQMTEKHSAHVSMTIVGITTSLVLGVTAWWFWTAIMQDPSRQTIDVIGYITLLGLVLSAVVVCIASLQFATKNTSFAKYATISGWLAFASLVSVMIISAFTYLPGSSATQSLGDAWRSFIGFGRIDLGVFGISITGTLALIGSVALVVAIVGRQRKQLML